MMFLFSLITLALAIAFVRIASKFGGIVQLLAALIALFFLGLSLASLLIPIEILMAIAFLITTKRSRILNQNNCSQ